MPERLSKLRCWSNDQPLTREYRSLEHVIPRSLGGHLISSALLCKECNTEFGKSIDAELERQLGIFGDLLGVKKQHSGRKEKRINLVSINGDKKAVGSRLKSYNEMKYPVPSGLEVIEFVPEAEAESFAAKKQRQLEEHGMRTTFKQYIKQPDGTLYYVTNNLSTEPGNIAFGGRNFMRATAKIAVNFAVMTGINPQLLAESIAFVRGEREHNDIVQWYYPNHYKLHELDLNEVCHIIHLCGSSQYRMLFSYIELFFQCFHNYSKYKK